MTSLAQRCLICLVCLVVSNLAYSQAITVSLPDTTSQTGASITIPIQVGNLTNRDVLFYQTVIVFDKNILRATDASTFGTLSQSFGDPTVDINVEGEILISASGNTPLSGSGTLVNLLFDVLGQQGETTNLTFALFTFNTGIPPATRKNGKFTVLVPPEADIKVTPKSHNFGNVFINSTASQSFVIANVGTANLEVNATTLTGANANQFKIVSGAAPLTIVPGDSQNLVVSFNPLSLGAKTAPLEIASNDPDQNILNIPLSGTGTPALEPDITVRPEQLNFGNVNLGSVSIISITIANVGIGNLTVNSMNVSGQNSTEFIIKGRKAPFNIAPADSEIFLISFKPESQGPQNAVIKILSDDPDEATLNVSLAGIGMSNLGIMPRIANPQDGTAVCGDSTPVEVVWAVTGGVGPFTISCEVNGIAGTRVDDMFTMDVPIALGENSLVATCTIVDNVGAMDTASTAIAVVREPLPSAALEIIFPRADTVVCDDKIKIQALARISGGTQPFNIICEINGITFTPEDTVFSTSVALAAGENQIIASCTITDSCGFEVAISDTISVFSDPTPPVCEINFDNYPVITGQVSDLESGIAFFEIIVLENRTISIDSFEVGDKAVGFTVDKIDLGAPANFIFRAFNGAGCEVICDPIDVTIRPSSSERRSFSIPKKERYMYVLNHGLDEIQLQINRVKFSLVTSANSEGNAYFIPRNGSSSFDLAASLSESDNEIAVTGFGPAGSSADILFTDFLVEGEIIILDPRASAKLPEEFNLAQNYPNPFNPSTRIQFDVSNQFPDGAHVQLEIYNLLGKLVRVLLDENRFPGNYEESWDGLDLQGNPVSSGIYFYHLRAGDFLQTKRMVLLR